MIEQLPISIRVGDELVNVFTNIKSVTNKLEAQFNFQTLTAAWYEDETKILSIQLLLETPLAFSFLQKQNYIGQVHEVADDVFYHQPTKNQLVCVIAITDAELTLIQQQPRLLTGYLQAKIHKILNLIAKRHKLFPI